MEISSLFCLLLLSATMHLGMGQVVSEVCMGCICEASSNCDRSLRCQDGVCGLFAITRAYWIDADKQLLRGDKKNNPRAYERCTTDPTCAAQTVQAYMAKYSKDCDRNGVVSCLDFGALHTLGVGCEGALDAEFKQRLDQCLLRFMPVKM